MSPPDEDRLPAELVTERERDDRFRPVGRRPRSPRLYARRAAARDPPDRVFDGGGVVGFEFIQWGDKAPGWHIIMAWIAEPWRRKGVLSRR